MATKSKKVAVFTGDLVNSTQLTKNQLSAAFDALSHCADTAADWHGASLQFTRHRGDGWQVVLNRPKYALRTALIFRGYLKALGPEYDTYIGMAEGIAKMEESADLNTRTEDVFVQSGRFLEGLKTVTGFTPKMSAGLHGSEAASAVLADHIVDGWTPAQAEVMAQLLQPNDKPNFTEIAKILNKSRQSVTKSLNAAGFRQISYALLLLENQDD